MDEAEQQQKKRHVSPLRGNWGNIPSGTTTASMQLKIFRDYVHILHISNSDPYNF